MLVGYSSGRTYKIYIPALRTFRITKDVSFIEAGTGVKAQGSRNQDVGWDDEELESFDPTRVPDNTANWENVDNVDPDPETPDPEEPVP